MKKTLFPNILLVASALLCLIILIEPESVLAGPLVKEQALIDYCEHQEWQKVQSLLEQGVKPDQAQKDGMTAMHWAAFHNQGDILTKLIESGGDVNALTLYQVSPLSLACEYGNTQAAVILINAKADVESARLGKETPLMYAARNGNIAILRELLNHKAKVDAKEKGGQTALMWGAASGHVEIVDELIKSKAQIDYQLTDPGFSAMMFAAREGHTKVVMRLLDAGINVNDVINSKKPDERGPRDGMSALLFAVESGHLELALELVKRGADPNDQRSGYTPLHAITWVRKTEVGDNAAGDPAPRIIGKFSTLDFVREIIKAGADVNCRLQEGKAGGKGKLNPKGATPLLFAAKNADLQLIELMLELGADPKISNQDGTTVVMTAAGVGVVAVGEEPGTEEEVNEAIKLFTGLGIDPNVVDKNGETAMHGAAYRTFPKAVACLSECGADPKIWNKENKYGWTPLEIAHGNRPGSVKPSPETIRAIEQALKDGLKNK